jgi:hypothetical protein
LRATAADKLRRLAQRLEVTNPVVNPEIALRAFSADAMLQQDTLWWDYPMPAPAVTALAAA